MKMHTVRWDVILPGSLTLFSSLHHFITIQSPSHLSDHQTTHVICRSKEQLSRLPSDQRSLYQAEMKAFAVTCLSKGDFSDRILVPEPEAEGKIINCSG